MDRSTLLFHLGESVPEDLISPVIELAQMHGWHLSGLASAGNVSPSYVLDTALGGGRSPARLALDLVRSATDRAAHFDERCRVAGHTDVDVQVVEDDSFSALARHSQACDLVVMRQGQTPEERRLVEDVGLRCGRPLLVVPHRPAVPMPGGTIVIAWDASAACARAMVDALPFLKRAACVRLIACQTAVDAAIVPGDLDAIGRWLQRHGVQVTPTIQPSMIDVGNMLLSRAADWGADLMVMGAYGHRRWAERIIGGTTLTVLNTMTVPLLLSH